MPSRMFTSMLDAFDRGVFPRSRKWAWRGIYSTLSSLWRDKDWRFMNFGFMPEGTPFTLQPEDEHDRPFIGLYQQAVDGLPVKGARVLEVGAGRGGGSRYIARYHAPASITGLDYSQQTVELAKRLNSDTPALAFQTGDAERLPFPDNSFDIVVNIESSHCYADVNAFAREVSRVLVPGGWFTFADMRSKVMLSDLETQLKAPGLEEVLVRDISMGVVAALDASDARKRERIRKVWLMRPFLTEFAGAKGSILYQSLAGRRTIYTARRYQKTG